MSGNYPEVRLDIRFSERMVNLVEEGIELALRIGKLESSTLVARRLGTVQRHLVATPTYLHGRPTPRTPDDLSAISASSIRARRGRMNGRSNPNMAATSSRSAGRSWSTMPTPCRKRRCSTWASPSCRTGMRRRGFAAASWRRPSGIFDCRPAASCGLSGDPLDVAAGAKLSRFAGQARRPVHARNSQMKGHAAFTLTRLGAQSSDQSVMQ